VDRSQCLATRSRCQRNKVAGRTNKRSFRLRARSRHRPERTARSAGYRARRWILGRSTVTSRRSMTTSIARSVSLRQESRIRWRTRQNARYPNERGTPDACHISADVKVQPHGSWMAFSAPTGFGEVGGGDERDVKRDCPLTKSSRRCIRNVSGITNQSNESGRASYQCRRPY